MQPLSQLLMYAAFIFIIGMGITNKPENKRPYLYGFIFSAIMAFISEIMLY